MALDLEKSIAEEQFILCPPKPVDEFIRLCEDCDLRITKENLEMLEREGLFYPLLRVRFPKYTQKIRRLDNNRYEVLGPLEDKEQWDGETEEVCGNFWFTRECAEDYYREGFLWQPEDRPFEAWTNFRDEEGAKTVESYYSPFQIYPLWSLWQTNLFLISLISWGSLDDETLQNRASELASLGKKLKKMWTERESRFQQVVDVCIAIANRYFPHTQTDQRTITLSRPGHYHDWDWYEYRRQWDPRDELAKLNIEPGRLRELQRTLASDASYIDPLVDWYSLVQFVSLEQKKKLKGKALLAQHLYSMEMMLRLFFEDVTGERLRPPDENFERWKERYYGQGVPEREMEFLEYLTNQFHLNPRPKLILVVEGESELEQFPRLAQALGYSFDRVGIRLEPLGGIGEFTGRNREPEWGGRLARFIDYHHQLQTIVYVVLDNEGGSPKVRDQLLRRKSKYSTSHRYTTKEDYVFLWERNFEFDNFSDSEIANALSYLAATAQVISEDDIRVCRENFGKPGFQLEKLFRSKTGKELAKRELARLLVDRLLENAKKDEGSHPPKIMKKLEEIIHLAATNHQPTGRETWLENQESGFLAPLAK